MTTGSTTATTLVPPVRPGGFAAALSAAAVTVPHAVGLGLLAFTPLAGDYPLSALALWSAAIPGAVLTLLKPRPGVIYAPTTVVALLFASIMALVAGSSGSMGLSPAQVLAVTGATVALAFVFQWLFGVMRLASLARFLPISVTHGFAAGVGLAMVASQLRTGFGSGGWAWDGRLVLHALAAFAVIALAVVLQRRWRRVPGLLPGVAIVSAAVMLSGLGGQFNPSIVPSAFAWPLWPDWLGVPWLVVLRRLGAPLVSLALLMAVVNSLEVLVFVQELDVEHGIRSDPNAMLRGESVIGALCGLAGMIPASTSASRSRIALAQSGPVMSAGPWHAAIMVGVAVTGHWWLQWVPMACLAGGLILAGFLQVPGALWSRRYARVVPAVWMQSWLVAMVFVAAGGAGALLAGLVVATFVLLHDSASNSVRRTHLDGQLRSRRLRRAASDVWLNQRMNRVAVFELQGVMSFGVAAHVAEHVRSHLLPRHDRVILDTSRVPVWDATALVQMRALARDLGQRGVEMMLSGLDERSRELAGEATRVLADRDRALEWAEDSMLEERAPNERPAYPEHEPLGEVGEGLALAARAELEALLRPEHMEPYAQLFNAGDTDSDLIIVQSGRVTMTTAWPPASGLRLATVGQGMALGEMAFLNGIARTACAGAEGEQARLARLSRDHFDTWARAHPRDALVFMSNLAQIGIRRLGATTRQLRAVLE